MVPMKGLILFGDQMHAGASPRTTAEETMDQTALLLIDLQRDFLEAIGCIAMGIEMIVSRHFPLQA